MSLPTPFGCSVKAFYCSEGLYWYNIHEKIAACLAQCEMESQYDAQRRHGLLQSIAPVVGGWVAFPGNMYQSIRSIIIPIYGLRFLVLDGFSETNSYESSNFSTAHAKQRRERTFEVASIFPANM